MLDARHSRASLFVARGSGLIRAIWKHPANRDQRMRAIFRFLGWQLDKHLLRRPRTIRFHNRLLKCYPDSNSTSAALYFAGLPDYWEMKFMQRFLRSGDQFIDIGANAGVYSVLASSITGTDAVIDAFEPLPNTASRIVEQARLNGLTRLRVHGVAVSDRDDVLEFGYSGNDATMHLRRDGEASTGTLRVRAVSLDNFTSYGTYAMGKMDIEGAEPLAFAGATRRLREANPPVWLLELAGYSNCYGVSSDEVLRRLHECGFDSAIFDPTSGNLEFTQQPWLKGCQNVLVIARSHREWVEGRLAQNSSPA